MVSTAEIAASTVALWVLMSAMPAPSRLERSSIPRSAGLISVLEPADDTALQNSQRRERDFNTSRIYGQLSRGGFQGSKV